MGDHIETLFKLLYYCQEGQRVAIVGSRTDDDPIRNSLYIEQEEDRRVREFISKDHDDGRLLVITGSAGDGKSALLERATRLAEDDVIPDKRVNMDATSARAADEDYDDRLNEFFNLVIDDVRSRSGQRSALAINYGLAVSFFEFGEYGDEYEAVWDALQQSQVEGDIDDHQNVDVINLSHRRTYNAHPDELGSGLLRQILDRFDPTHESSPFTEAFEREREACPAGENCPLHYNVQQLTDEQVKDRLAELFASTSIIRGSYLNPRMILDRISRTLLPASIRDVPDHDVCPVGAAVESGAMEVDVEDLIWNTAFETLDTSTATASFVDPASRTDFTTDQEILTWSVHEDDLNSDLPGIQIEDVISRERIRTLLRKRYLHPEPPHMDSFISENQTFREFSAALTYFTSNDPEATIAQIGDEVQSFVATIEDALDNWTGQQSSGNLVEFRDARRSTDYRFLSEWDAPDVALDASAEETRKISTPGRVRLQINPAHRPNYEIPMPLFFDLYRLMYRVSEGYTPNSTDMNRSHAIQMLQTRMSELTRKGEFVQIQDRSGDRSITLQSDRFGVSLSAEGFE